MFAHTKFSGVKVNESGESWKWGKWVLACGWYICMYISLTCLRVLHVSSVPFVPIWDLLVSFLLFLFSVRLAICKQKFLTFSFLGKILVYTCVYVCLCVQHICGKGNGVPTWIVFHSLGPSPNEMFTFCWWLWNGYNVGKDMMSGRFHV